MKPITEYILHLADNALILGHRNSEWTGHGPVLEQDIALSNISLDLIGQARNFYQYAAKILSETSETVVTEDTLAYHRDVWEFKNFLMLEQSNGDWGKTILRQFFFSVYQSCLYEKLLSGEDRTIAAISEKALKEVSYHIKWSGDWVVRLGDGTEESHQRMQGAYNDLRDYTGEFFIPSDHGPDTESIKEQWTEKVNAVLAEATLPSISLVDQDHSIHSGIEGRHSEQLGQILADMQYLQRAYPGCEW